MDLIKRGYVNIYDIYCDDLTIYTEKKAKVKVRFVLI